MIDLDDTYTGCKDIVPYPYNFIYRTNGGSNGQLCSSFTVRNRTNGEISEANETKDQFSQYG